MQLYCNQFLFWFRLSHYVKLYLSYFSSAYSDHQLKYLPNLFCLIYPSFLPHHVLYRLIILCVPINFQRHVPSLFVILAKLQYNNFKFCLLVMMVPLLLCDVIRFLYTKPPGITFCWKTTFLYQFIFSFTSYVQYIIYPHLSQNNLNFSISIWFLNIQHFFLRWYLHYCHLFLVLHDQYPIFKVLKFAPYVAF